MKLANKICPFCGKLVVGKSHFKKCHMYPENLNESDAWLKMIEVTFSINTNELVIDYVENKKSLPEIKELYKIDFKSIYKILEIKGFKVRTISESHENAYKKAQLTSLLKYGVDNISKLDRIKEQKKLTFLAHYGVDNIFKTDEFKIALNKHMLEKFGKLSVPNGKKISETRKLFTTEKREEIRKKYKETSFNNYGVEHPFKCKEVSNKATHTKSLFSIEKWNTINEKTRKTNNLKYGVDYLFQLSNTFISKLELEVCNILKENNIDFVQQKFINKNAYDILLTKQKLIIEVNGDFWHANPLIYKENDILNHPINSVIAKDLWKKDADKRINAEQYGYKVLYIWEHDIRYAIKNNNLEEFILNKINNVSKN
jgi:G:T-mismatch repair DNA endonuclease (very short patch repair protein)